MHTLGIGVVRPELTTSYMVNEASTPPYYYVQLIFLSIYYIPVELFDLEIVRPIHDNQRIV